MVITESFGLKAARLIICQKWQSWISGLQLHFITKQKAVSDFTWWGIPGHTCRSSLWNGRWAANQTESSRLCDSPLASSAYWFGYPSPLLNSRQISSTISLQETILRISQYGVAIMPFSSFWGGTCQSSMIGGRRKPAGPSSDRFIALWFWKPTLPILLVIIYIAHPHFSYFALEVKTKIGVLQYYQIASAETLFIPSVFMHLNGVRLRWVRNPG